MIRKTLSPVDKAYWESRAKSHADARNSMSHCPLMGDKIQLLPLRSGRVERLHSRADSLPYSGLKRPLGLRLIRDGYLYVIDENSGYLHEYRLDNGVPTKMLWQDREVAQDVRQTSIGEHTLIFPVTPRCMSLTRNCNGQRPSACTCRVTQQTFSTSCRK